MTISFRNRLENLVKITESTLWSRNPELASQRTVDVLAEVLDCDMAFIHLLDFSGDFLIKIVTHGNPPGGISTDSRVSITTGRMLQMMKTHQPIIMDFQHPDPADIIPGGLIELNSAMSVPILAGNDFLGMFSIVYKKHLIWKKQDINYLLYIGRVLGISIQHAQIAQKASDLEILMERKRICGELHDNLAQLVNSLNLSAEAALLSWQEGNQDQLQNDLERIKNTSQIADRTLREEMLSLRTSANETEGLIPGVREYLKRFTQQWCINTNLYMDDQLEHLVVSTQMELQFMRILHEALLNVLRHATASNVSVTIENDQNTLSMQIHDNGRGFNPEAISCERLGLWIMRERAESLGGELTITSAEGMGTTIRVDVPWYA